MNTNRTLKERITFPDWTEYPEGSEEDYMEFFHDYGINLIQITKMSDAEIMNRFFSDFRVVAYHFKHWKDPDYKPLDQDLIHVDAVLKMISVMSGDEAYEKVVGIMGERRPKKLNDYVRKVRLTQKAIGAVEVLRNLGWSNSDIKVELMKTYEGITEEEARSYISMADEEMKGVTA